MHFTDSFTQHRLNIKSYAKQLSSYPLKRFLHLAGWTDTVVDNELIFSYRGYTHSKSVFAESLHTHEFYELVFYIDGSVCFITENTQIDATPRLVTWAKPGQPHGNQILEPCTYERYVIYFSPAFFTMGAQPCPMPDFITQSFGTHMILSSSAYQELLELLKKAERMANSKKPYAELVLKAILIEFFYRLDALGQNIQTGENLPGRAGDVKRYIDEKYATISSIGEIAEHFFYSREHLSRNFKQVFGLSAAEYLTRRRIMESLALLEYKSIAEAAYAVGFRSQSAFINSFRRIMHCLPSEYKARHKRL